MADPLSMADPLVTPAASPSRSGGSPPALRVEGLRKTYEDGFTAVAGLDLEIPDGAFFGLLGPNGTGKSTLTGSVCNIVRPTAGTLSVFGHDHRSRQARRLLGLAAQEINVDRFLSIRQILIYHAGYHGIGRKAAARRADELLALFRLDDKATRPTGAACTSRGHSCRAGAGLLAGLMPQAGHELRRRLDPVAPGEEQTSRHWCSVQRLPPVR